MLEQAQAASRLHRWQWLSVKMSSDGPLLVCCEGKAVVYVCCSLSILCFLYLQGLLLVPQGPQSLFGGIFWERKTDTCINRFPP